MDTSEPGGDAREEDPETMTTITTKIEGTPVRGRITERSAASIEVVLEEPYGHLHLTDDSNVMAAAQRYISLEGARGEDVAVRLLRDLYLLALYIEDNRQELEVQWGIIRRQLDERRPSAVKSPAELKQRIAMMGEQLRNGAISGTQYKQAVRILRSDFEEWGFAFEDAAEAMWQGFDLSYELLLQAIRVVDPTFIVDESDDQGGGDE